MGDFVGSLSTQFLTTKTGLSDPGLFIAGDLLAPITVDEDLRTFIDIEGDADANITITQQLRGRLRIGGSLLSGRTIACQALTESGVNGQVIINALNSSSTWSGSVTVNGTALATKPYYSNTGLGGAVGLAPFQCHLADCSPAHLATVTSWTPSTSTVTLRHYGPITWTGMPVTISKCNNWEDCDPNGTFVTDNWEAINSPSAGGRDLVLRLKSGQSLPADTHYHFFPVRTGTNMLKCADLMAGGNVPVADYMYEFVYDP